MTRQLRERGQLAPSAPQALPRERVEQVLDGLVEASARDALPTG